MDALTDFLSSPVAERIGLTLLHSIWQLTFVRRGCVFLVLRSLRSVLSSRSLLGFLFGVVTNGCDAGADASR